MMVASLVALLAFSQAPAHLKYRGNDISFIPQVEAGGGVYRDKGKPGDPLTIEAAHGLNLARIRIWVNPTDKWCDLPHTLALAKRVKKSGMQFLLNFHYSDWWADPGKQNKPAAWANLHDESLERQVQSYTKFVVQALVKQGTPPDMVQVGNEIRVGMLWPDGKVAGDLEKQWPALVKLFMAGRQGVIDGAGGHHIPIVLHIDSGGDMKGSQYFFDKALSLGAKFDLIALSYYPWWHGTMPQLKENLNNLANRYGKGILVVETAYPFTLDKMKGGFHMVSEPSKLIPFYPATPNGQSSYLKDLCKIIRETPKGLGLGLIYWVADWLVVPGGESGWENVNLFDGTGNALPGLDALGAG